MGASLNSERPAALLIILMLATRTSGTNTYQEFKRISPVYGGSGLQLASPVLHLPKPSRIPQPVRP